MSGNTDTVLGRIKQAIGALTGSKKLKQEGRRDELGGSAKSRAAETIDAIKNKVDDAHDAFWTAKKEK